MVHLNVHGVKKRVDEIFVKKDMEDFYDPYRREKKSRIEVLEENREDGFVVVNRNFDGGYVVTEDVQFPSFRRSCVNKNAGNDRRLDVSNNNVVNTALNSNRFNGNYSNSNSDNKSNNNSDNNEFNDNENIPDYLNPVVLKKTTKNILKF